MLVIIDYSLSQGDGHDFTQHIRQLRLEALCFLNITSYGSGNNPWGAPPPGTFSGRVSIRINEISDLYVFVYV